MEEIKELKEGKVKEEEEVVDERNEVNKKTEDKEMEDGRSEGV